MSINLAMSAISSAIGQGLTALSNDPLLVWNYGVVAVLAFFGGIFFWICFHNLDKDEDSWNSIAKSEYTGKSAADPSTSEPTVEIVKEKI